MFPMSNCSANGTTARDQDTVGQITLCGLFDRRKVDLAKGKSLLR